MKLLLITFLTLLLLQGAKAQTARTRFANRTAGIPTPPVITNVSQLNAGTGATISLTGSGFSTTAANNIVFFGAVATVPVAAGSNSLTVTVPAGATYGNLSVLNTATQLSGTGKQYFNPTFSPNKGSIAPGDIQAKTDFTASAQPRAIAIRDLDGDGKSDLVIASASSGTISVLRNTSTSGSITAGSFAAKVDFTTGGYVYSLATGDVDGDGKPDLLSANTGANTVSVLRNTSTPGSIHAGSFAARVDFATGTGPVSITNGDIDGDGKSDIVVANTGINDASVSILRNTGSPGSIVAGSFAAPVDLTAGTEAFQSIAITDVDGDGKFDLVVANSNDNTVSVWRNISSPGSITTASFATKVDFVTGSVPYFVIASDLDGDGKPDLATANYYDNSISVLRNTGTPGSITTGSFAPKTDFTTGNNPFSLAAGDLDGDGKPDLAAANNTGNSISILRNTGTTGSITTGSFAAKADVATGSSPYMLAIGDLDGDGKPDLATVNDPANTVSVLRNNPQITALPVSLGSFTAVQQTGGVLLQWHTLAEKNNKAFRLSRSADGTHFSELASIAGAGTSSGMQHYTYTDPIPLKGTGYYKLQQTDYDGKTTELGIRVVNFSLSSTALNAWPNPSVGGFTVWSNKAQQAQVIHTSGQIILPKLNLAAGTNTIDASGWPAGVYLLQTGTAQVKLIRQ
jgi:hypothetical protein